MTKLPYDYTFEPLKKEAWVTVDGQHIYMLGPGEDPSVLEPKTITSLQDYTKDEKGAFELNFKKQAKGQGYEIKRLDERELKYALTEGKFGLVSGGPNKFLDPKDADEKFYKERTNALEQELISRGYTYTPVVGHFFGREDSFLVMAHDADREEIKEIGVKFNQQSVIFSDKGSNEMIQVSDGIHPKGSVWSAKGYTLGEPEKDNLYTEVPVRGFKVAKVVLDTGFYGENPPHRKEMVEGFVTLEDGRVVFIDDEKDYRNRINITDGSREATSYLTRLKGEGLDKVVRAHINKIPARYLKSVKEIRVLTPDEMVNETGDPRAMSFGGYYNQMTNEIVIATSSIEIEEEAKIGLTGIPLDDADRSTWLDFTVQHEVGHAVYRGELEHDKRSLWETMHELASTNTYGQPTGEIYGKSNLNNRMGIPWGRGKINESEGWAETFRTFIAEDSGKKVDGGLALETMKTLLGRKSSWTSSDYIKAISKAKDDGPKYANKTYMDGDIDRLIKIFKEVNP